MMLTAFSEQASCNGNVASAFPEHATMFVSWFYRLCLNIRVRVLVYLLL